VLSTVAAHAAYNPGQMAFERVFAPLSFVQPVHMLEIPDGSGRMVVAERAGVLKVFDKADPGAGVTVWMDIQDRVATARDQALMAMAFAPDYATSTVIYLHYSYDDGTPWGPGRLSRFTVAPDGLSVLPASEEVILEVEQPFQDHNGGSIEFGPDGMLYWALGDGGSRTGPNAGLPPAWRPPLNAFDPDSQDPMRNGQNTTNLLGKILRLDVSGPPDPGKNYAVPPDNPFVAGGPDGPATRPEIFAYGFRNPWRMAFDPNTGQLICVDVGGKLNEEVNLVTAGGNYGWSVMEGIDCLRPGDPCEPTDFIAPTINHPWTDGPTNAQKLRSLTGGYVYTASRVPALQGAFIYGDYISGRMFAAHFPAAGPEWAEVVTPPGTTLIAGIGRDDSGEVYILNFSSGQIFQLTPLVDLPHVGVQLAGPAPTAAGQDFDVDIVVLGNTGGTIPGAAALELQFNADALEFVPAGTTERELGPVIASNVGGTAPNNTLRVATQGDANNTNPTPVIATLRFRTRNHPNPVSLGIAADPDAGAPLLATDLTTQFGATFAASPSFSWTNPTPTPTPTPSPTPSPSPSPSPTPSISPTPSPTPSPSIQLSALTINFGAVEMGDPAVVQSVTVENVGGSDLWTTTTLVNSGAGSYAIDTAPAAMLAPAGTSSLAVGFAPTALGARSGQVQLATNDPANPLVAVNLVGTGIDSQAPSTEVTAPTGVLDPAQPVLSVIWTGADTPGGSGLLGVELFYRRDGSPYASFGVYTTSPISFNTAFTGGAGTYGWYTRGIDAAGNVEPAPIVPDVEATLPPLAAVDDWTLLD
jgi:glucose/arabinose dehydrogenase